MNVPTPLNNANPLVPQGRPEVALDPEKEEAVL